MLNNKKGFTLIEILAVIVILGLLVAIAIPAISKNINETRTQAYTLHEADMKDATANMMSECLAKGTLNCVPKKGQSRTYYLSSLIDLNYSNVLKDPADTSKKCDEEKSYVIVKNTGKSNTNLEYQVCLVCSEYSSDICEEGPVLTCDPESDNEAPVCGTVIGESTVWTNEDRVMSVGCSDNGCGCVEDTVYKKFNTSTKKSQITITDHAGKTNECDVDVYVDKDIPECGLTIIGNKGANNWYSGDEVRVEFEYKKDQDDLSGLVTYGIGTSRNNRTYNKADSFTVLPGITTVYGYVKDKAGNEGICSVEVKYDSENPTGEITYGYQVYPKEDIAVIESNTIKLNTRTKEYGNVIGAKVYLSSNPLGISNTTVKNGSTVLATRTISAGVTEMLYTFDAGVYAGITIDMISSANVGKVEKVELITDHTRVATSANFYTNKDVKVYVTSLDSYSGKDQYSFDGGSTWQNSNEYTYGVNNSYHIFIRDLAGNNSNSFASNINNIDKLEPLDAKYSVNGGEYTINVGETSKKISTTVTISDAEATSSYAKSGVTMIYLAWTTTLTEPLSWQTSSPSASKTSTGGSNYLWVKTIDRAGNKKITRSNGFNVGYQVKFNCNGGSGCPSDQRKVYNESLTLSNTIPTRTGYEFMGWGLNASTHIVTYNAGGSYTKDEPIELYAIWKKTLEFTFNANGATLDATSKSCDLYNAETSCSIKLPKITRSGGTVYGFNTNKNATSATSGWTSQATVTVNVSTSKTWYAITKKNAITYTVSYSANGGSGTTSPTSCTIAEVYNVATQATSCTVSIANNKFTYDGHTFTGWKTSSGTSYTAGGSASISSNLTLNAQWRANILKVYYNANGGTLNSSTYTLTSNNIYRNGSKFSHNWTYNIADENGLYNASTFGLSRVGYVFVGWNTKADGTGDFFDQNNGTIKPTDLKDAIKNGDTELTLYAQWEENSYTITYHIGNATSTAGSTVIGTTLCKYNSSCTLKTFESLGVAFPYGPSTDDDYNWYFAGWSTSQTGLDLDYSDGKTFTHSVESDINLYAVGKKTFYFFSGLAPTAASSTSIQYWNPYSTSTNYMSSITIPNYTEISGWTFVGYKAGSSNAKAGVTFDLGDIASKVTPAYNVHAWNRSLYTREVNINYLGNGSTSGSTLASKATQYYNSGIPKSGANNGSVSTPSFNLRANGFSKTGHTFSKWAEGSTSGTQYAAGATYTGFVPSVTSTSTTKNMYAIWTVNTLKVYYNANGGTLNSSTYTLTSNNIYRNGSRFSHDWTYNIADEYGLYNASTFGLSRTGYTFAGWSKNADGSGDLYDQDDTTIIPTDLNSSIESGNVTVTLYAKWTANTLKVYYNANGGSVTNTTVDGNDYYHNLTSEKNIIHSNNSSTTAAFYQTWTYNNKQTYGLTDASTFGLSKTGYKFVGWNTKSDGSGTTYLQNNNDLVPTDLNSGIASGNVTLTLYAQWDENVLTICYFPNGGTVNSGYSLQTSGDCSGAVMKTHKYSGLSNNLYNVETLFSREGYATYSTAKAWRLGSATSTTYYDQSDQDLISLVNNGDKTIKLYANWKKTENDIVTLCNLYGGGSGADTPLFGNGKGNKTGTKADGSTLLNYGSLKQNVDAYWCTSGCSKTEGYIRICVDDECGAFKGKSAADMNDAAATAGISESDCHFSNYWCKCD